MSRYYDGDGDADPNFQNEWQFWQANARRALKGKRGRRVLAELREALANLPDKRLISRALCTANPARREPPVRVIDLPWEEKPYVDDSARREFAELVEDQGEGVCAVGALLWWRKVKAGADPVEAFDQLPTLADWDAGLEQTADLAKAEAGVVWPLAWQLAYHNDETFEGCTPEERYEKFMAWLEGELAGSAL
jgi:hypothetical protein